MANIGFVATRLAGVDGVSLESAKMVQVLERMGHRCFYCAGELGPDSPPGRVVPEMNFNEILVKAMHDQAFFYTTKADAPLFELIYDDADLIRRKIETFVQDFAIDVLISQNASTIPMNLSLGLAIRDFVARSRLPTLCHHHDFYWERDRFLNGSIQDILDEAFPPRLEPIRHLVISSIMQRRLASWLGMDSEYLPNVMDYDNPPPPPDEFALSFRAQLGLKDDDIIILQPTRIIRRKAIEKAIELVRKLGDKRLVLLITGYEGDELSGYGAWLHEEAERAGIRYRFIGEQVGTRRGGPSQKEQKEKVDTPPTEIDAENRGVEPLIHHQGTLGDDNEKPIFSLWDCYQNADLITYPSTYEGFGNALLETMYFRKPFVVHLYPAYAVDIRPTGVRAIEFNHEITPDTLAQVRRVLTDEAWRNEMVEHNYAVGRKHFSLARMETVLRRVLADF